MCVKEMPEYISFFLYRQTSKVNDYLWSNIKMTLVPLVLVVLRCSPFCKEFFFKS